MPRFRIGIDLGTTNCAIASVAEGGVADGSVVLSIPQAETAHSQGIASTLPSCLYLPPGESGRDAWIAGRWARTRAAEVPGRVVRSAKSWLGHHAVDRHAKFLPLGSPDLAPSELLSPVEAQAALLRTLAATWNVAHPAAPLAEQEVAVTVPASFDPVAQQLTLEAAQLAGFPADTLLLEEPQAAFYAWLEAQAATGENEAPRPLPGLIVGKPAHVLVVDLGGGTTDFSLFSVEQRPGNDLPLLRRLAVSEHLLLGGDNLDLTLAHHVETQLGRGTELPPTAFAQLLARCREIKEEALNGAEGEVGPSNERSWPIAVARPGASLLTGTLRTEIGSREIGRLLIEGFFPRVGAAERALRAGGGLREMGLPYARDPAITRHLAEFLRDRPKIDYLLCNGGLTKARRVRERLLQNLTDWQGGRSPELLENTEPDLAVARGAARFLHLRARGDSARIEAGAAHAYYVGVGDTNLLCVLPLGTRPEQPTIAENPGLRALIGQPAAFPLFWHSRRPGDVAGAIVSTEGDDGFAELPSIETRLAPPKGERIPKDPRVAVRLRTTLRATGLLRVELLCAEPELAWKTPWPLEFALRNHPPAVAHPKPSPSSAGTPAPAEPSLPAPTLPLVPAAAAAMVKRFKQGTVGKDRLTANAVFTAGERILGAPRPSWNASLVRALFDVWSEATTRRPQTTEHEEAWYQVTGFLLRPGRGSPRDPDRLESIWPVLADVSPKIRPAVKVQRWICARRLAAGLRPEQAAAIWEQAAADWAGGSAPTAEIALLAGALENLPVGLRGDLASRIAGSVLAQPQDGALWKSLGRLLSRVLFHAGTDQVVSPDVVTRIWDQLKEAVVPESARPDATHAWLRAARRTGLRPLDVGSGCRNGIDALLRRWGVPDTRRNPLHEVMPVVVAEQSSLVGEGLPAGLSLGGADWAGRTNAI